MKGYVFHYYKYAPYIKERSIDDNVTKVQDYITFGEYDRLAIAQINDFTRYRDLFEHANIWKGKRRSVLLYEIEQTSDYPLRITGRTNEEKKFGFSFADSILSQHDERLFLGLTIITVSQKIRRSEYFGEILKNIRCKILNLLDKLKLPMEYEVFGTLGSSGVAILWFSDQYTDVLSLVEEIGKLYVYDQNKDQDENAQEKCFLSLYTIFSKNRIPENPDNIKQINQIDGQGTLYFALNERKNIEEFGTFLKSVFKGDYNPTCLQHCSGEYDYSYRVDIKHIYSKFDSTENDSKKASCLNIDNSQFKEHISRTKLIFQEGHSDEINSRIEHLQNFSFQVFEIPKKGGQAEKKIDETDNENESIVANYNKLREQLKEGFPHTAGMVDTLDLLYSDYKSNYNPKEHIWSPDFKEQFSCILDHLYKAYECSDIYDKESKIVKQDYVLTKEDYLMRIRDLTSALNQQIYHMFDSSQMYLEVPPCHLKYTGQHDMILYAYFGLVKYIISTLYKVQRNSFQPELIPLITIDIVPLIQTRLYTDIADYRERRIVTIGLPNVCLFDFPTYIGYTIHELFHYSAPQNRGIRNKYYLLVVCTEFLTRVVAKVVELSLNMEEESINDILTQQVVFKENALNPEAIQIVRKYCFKYLNSRIDDISNILQNFFQEKQKNNFLLLDYLMKELILIIDQFNEVDDFDEAYKNVVQRLKRIFTEFFINDEKINIFSQFIIEVIDVPSIKSRIDEFDLKEKFLSNFQDISKFDSIISRAIQLEVSCQNIDIVYQDTIDAFREVSADIAMIDLCKMDLIDYLFRYIRVKKDLLQSPKEITEVKRGECLRIGMIISCFIANDIFDFKLSNYRKDFVVRYITYYLTIDKNNIIEGNKEIQRLKEEAELWFNNFIEKVYLVYMRDYSIYSCTVFKDIAKQYHVEPKLCDDFNEKCEYEEYKRIFTNCEKAIVKYLDKLQQANVKDIAAYKELCKAKDDFNESFFALNVKIIQTFQNQETLEYIQKLYSPNEEGELVEVPALNNKYKIDMVVDMNSGVTVGVNRSYTVYGVNQLVYTILICADNLKSVHKKLGLGENAEIWYRGHEINKWSLMPNLLRKNTDERTLAEIQRENVEKFKAVYRNVDFAESFRPMETIELLTIMQHYGAKTNLLDWSQDAISALYFSLRNIVDDNIDKIDSKELDYWLNSPAELYLFSPLIYNRAMRKVLIYKKKTRGRKWKKQYRVLRKLEEDIIRVWGNEIPYISMKEYESHYDAYVCGNLSVENAISHLPFSDDVSSFLPIAILTPKVYPRVKAQSGRFLAYNLYAKKCGSEDPYDYLDLNKLQEIFIEKFKKMGCADLRECVFLYKIILPNFVVQQRIATWLRAIGMKNDRVYPELENTLKHL